MSIKFTCLVLAVAAIGCDVKKSSHDDATPAAVVASPAATTPPPAPIDITVDVAARQLFDDYRANVIGADEKYKGKGLRVTGIVDHVSREGSKKAFLDFRVYRTERVQAHFDRAIELAEVKPGSETTVRCVGDGEFGGPQLKNCALE
jgi:hypothetical protein